MSRQQKRPRRPVHGVLLLDKPTGISSNQALQRAKHLFGAAKAGHTGSLDPLATGMLPLCFGEATKLSGYLLDADKAYLTTARLGIITDSGDSDGTVIEERAVPEGVDKARIEALLAEFTGTIEQVPPMYSALKHQGQRLYQLARQGKTVERKPRSVRIEQLQLESFTPDTLTLSVRCSKGTYIRSLVEDLGQALGCGAHIEMLRRTAVAPYEAGTMYTLDSLTELASKEGEMALDRYLLPLDSALGHLPTVLLQNRARVTYCHGNRQTLDARALIAPGQTLESLYGLARVYAGEQLDEGEFLGLGELRASSTGAQAETSTGAASMQVELQPKKVLNL